MAGLLLLGALGQPLHQSHILQLPFEVLEGWGSPLGLPPLGSHILGLGSQLPPPPTPLLGP